MKDPKNPEINELKVMMADLIQSRKESDIKFDEKLKESKKELKAEMKEGAENFKAEMKERDRKFDEKLENSRKEFKAEMKERDHKYDMRNQKAEKRLRKIERLFQDLGISTGEIAEEKFYRNIRSIFKSRNKRFDQVKRNVMGDNCEFDVVAINGKEVLVLEVKNKLKNQHIDKFVKTQIPKFKESFPEYSKYNILGAVGGLVVKDEVESYAQRAGLYVLTQNDQGLTKIANPKDFQEKVW